MSSRRRWTRCAGHWSRVDIKTGELHRPEHVQALIEGVAQRIESLGVGECAKLAKYLRNRAPGLVLAQKSVLPRLEALAERWSVQAVSRGVHLLVLGQGAAQAPCPRAATRALSSDHLLGAYGALQDRTWPRAAHRCSMPSRTRAAVQNALSRLECHRGVQVRHYAPISTSTRAPLRAFSTCSAPGSICARGAGDRHRRGPALTSSLTGQRVHDWLTLLGCPPSPTLH